jgi:drug/metabolite transporter (DMT)-like permease
MAPTQSPPSRGYLFLFIAVLFWGGSASLAKYLLTTKFDTLIITQTRSSLSFVLLAAYFAFKDRSVFRIAFADLYQFALVGVFGIAVTNFSYYFTVQLTTVATAILVQYTAPVMVMLYAVFISKEEELNGLKLVSLLLALGGCYFAVSGGTGTVIQLSGWGLVAGPISAISFAFMLLFSKRVLRKYPVWTMLVYAFGFSMLFWLVVNPPWAIAAKGYTSEDWGIFWLFAVVSILIPHALFMKSLSLLDATSVGIASTMEPVVAIVVAYIVLGESLSGVQAFGALAVVAAVLLLQLRPLMIKLAGTDHEK